MKKIWKIAIVGTGAIGRSHMNAIDISENCTLGAVCDINEEAVKEYAEKYNVPYFTDYKEIPEKTDCDIVIINLPHWLHCESTIFFLDKGMHVFIEKPMANTVEECERMIEASERNGKKLIVGHVQRYFVSNRKIKELVESGEYGPLCMMSERRTEDYFSESRPAWFLDKKRSGGGILMNYCAHSIDKLFYITGEQDAEVYSNFGNIKTDHDVDGHAQVLMKFPSGLCASLMYDGYTRSGFEMYFHFRDAVIKIDQYHSFIRKNGSEWEPYDAEETYKYMYFQIEELCKCLNGEPNEITDGEYGKNVLKVLEKIYNQK